MAKIRIVKKSAYGQDEYDITRDRVLSPVQVALKSATYNFGNFVDHVLRSPKLIEADHPTLQKVRAMLPVVKKLEQDIKSLKV